jgi:hypothetical protein
MGFSLSRVSITRVRLVERFIAIFLLLVLLITALGFFPFSHSKFRDYLKGALIKEGVEHCSVGKVAITLWKKIEITDIEIGMSEKGQSYLFQSDKIQVSFNLFSVLFRLKQLKGEFADLSVKRRLLSDPLSVLEDLIRIRSRYNNFEEVKLYRVALKVTKGKKNDIVAKDFSFEIGPGDEGAGVIECFFEGDEVYYRKNFVTDIKGVVTYDGRVRLNRCKGRAYGGKFRVSSVIDPEKRYLEQLSFSGSGLNLKRLYQAQQFGSGEVGGKADIEIRLWGNLEIDSLRGTAAINVTEFSTRGLSIQEAFSFFLSAPEFKELRFSKFKADLQLQGQGKLLTAMSGSGEMLDLNADGWISLDGELNQEMRGEISAKMARKLSNLVAGSLESTERRGKLFKCRVYGSLSNPKIELDRMILKRAVGNVFQNMRQGFQDLFKKK